MNVISFVVRKSVVSYRTACPVDFDIVMQTINVTILCACRPFSFKIPHRITPTMIIIRFTLTTKFLLPSPPPASSLSPTSLLPLSATLPSQSLTLLPLRKSASSNYYCDFNSISLQIALTIFITLSFNVILNFQSAKMILGFKIFSIFILFILI